MCSLSRGTTFVPVIRYPVRSGYKRMRPASDATISRMLVRTFCGAEGKPARVPGLRPERIFRVTRQPGGPEGRGSQSFA